jgi:4Fe-4S ferredoxin
MSTRGRIVKTDTPERQTLLRPMVLRRSELVLDHTACCGCVICKLVCPHEAITVSAGELAGGRMTVAPRMDIDPAKCSMCGECVVVCPTHALSMTIDGKPEIPVISGKAFPYLLRNVRVNQEAASASLDTSYIDNCPVGAISADVALDDDGQIASVSNVEVDRAKCIACTRCMQLGPEGAFAITKPYQGHVRLNVSLCPEGCQACADVCPTKCISYDGQQVSVDERFCIYCGACEHVCPAEGAIAVQRTNILHTPIESGAWVKALDKLVAYEAVVREYDRKGQLRRRRAVLTGLLRELPEDEVNRK